MKNVCIYVAAAVAIATLGAAPALADTGSKFVSAEFRYDADKSAAANYVSFERKAKRACESTSRRPLALSVHEKACTADLMDRMVDRMGRADLAAIHTGRAGAVFAAR
jgi:hypothetical protein